MVEHMQSAITQQEIIRVRGNSSTEDIDFLASEEPLEIRLLFGPAGQVCPIFCLLVEGETILKRRSYSCHENNQIIPLI